MTDKKELRKKLKRANSRLDTLRKKGYGNISVIPLALKQMEIATGETQKKYFKMGRSKTEQDLEKMKTLGITICFSYSGDGKYLTDTRERTDISDELYDEIFSLIARHPEFGCHPMVGACNISKWVENYDWWLDQYKKYFPNDEDFQPSMLEVRNDDWTKENIQDYKNAEIETLVADALYSRDMGLLDSYLEMFNLLSNEVSDDDVRQIKTLAANSKTLGSAIENLTDDEIKEQYKNKARTTKEKI